MYLLLWIVAVALVVYGIFRILAGDVVLGIVLIVVGLLVGPGGVSLVRGHHGALGPPAAPVTRAA